MKKCKISLMLLFGIIFLISINLVKGSLTDGLILYYSFDDGTSTDISDNGYNGVDTDITYTDNGKILKSAEFNGTTSYIDTTYSVVNAIYNNKVVSISLWAYIRSDTIVNSGDGMSVFGNGGTSSTYGWFELTLFNDNGVKKIRVIGGSGTGEAILKTYSEAGINEDAWNHIVVIYNRNNVDNGYKRELYVNGVLVGYNDLGFGSENSQKHFYLGAVCSGGSSTEPANFFKGKIDEVGIWERKLNNSEISDLYNNGFGHNPFSNNNNNITIYFTKNIDNNSDISGKVNISGYGIYDIINGICHTNISVNDSITINFTAYNITNTYGRPFLNLNKNNVNFTTDNYTRTYEVLPYYNVSVYDLYSNNSACSEANSNMYVAFSSTNITYGNCNVFVPYYAQDFEVGISENNTFYPKKINNITQDLKLKLIPFWHVINYSFYNYTSFNYSNTTKNYTDSLKLKLNFVCPSNKNTSILFYLNKTKKEYKNIVCYNQSHEYEFVLNNSEEGEYIINSYYITGVENNMFDNNMTIFENKSFIYDLYAPTINLFNYSYLEGITNNRTGIIEISVNDSISPLIFCKIKANDELIKINLSRNNQSNLSFYLVDGLNNIYLNCSDVLNHTTYDANSFSVYIKKIILISENNASVFSSFSDMNMLRLVSGNQSFNFLEGNISEINIISNTDESLRLEKRYSIDPDTSLYVDLRLSMIPNETRVCVAPPQSFYEIMLYSSVNKPVAMINNYANCYVLADRTKYAYQDAVMEKAYTIRDIYYLYTYDENNNKIFLSAIDGGSASSIALDVLQSSIKKYTFSLTTDDVSFERISNTTLKIYYLNNKDDNIKTKIEIYNLNGSILFSHLETESPNEFTIYFDFSTIQTSKVMILRVIKYKENNQISVYERRFTKEGGVGIIDYRVVLFFVILFIFFGLTFVSMKYTFGWFGMIMIGVAIAITSLAVRNKYIVFIQAILFILLIYIFINYKSENQGFV